MLPKKVRTKLYIPVHQINGTSFKKESIQCIFCIFFTIFPQIALAIGVLTSSLGVGDHDISCWEGGCPCRENGFIPWRLFPRWIAWWPPAAPWRRGNAPPWRGPRRPSKRRTPKSVPRPWGCFRRMGNSGPPTKKTLRAKLVGNDGGVFFYNLVF